MFAPLPFLIVAGRKHYSVDVVRRSSAAPALEHW
jgi:hypothetical protein